MHLMQFVLQVLQHWQMVQKEAANVRMLHELQLTHKARSHHSTMLGLRTLHGWAAAAVDSKEEAAAQARKDAIWDKIQHWLAQDNCRPTNLEAITAAPFLQVACSPTQMWHSMFLCEHISVFSHVLTM